MRERLIEIKQDRPGFDNFFGSWICRDDHTLVIDVGPANSAGRFIDTLESLGLERIDYILLSHIHIDHSGALADVLDHYPMAKAICHQKAIAFLIDPSRLWEGSVELLGDVAEMYGKPRPVSGERLIPHTETAVTDLTVIETPGHAAHHLSFVYKNRLFVGEAAGNYLVIGDREYLRPATPPRFFLNVCLESVNRLLALENQPICYAHFGRAENSRQLLERFRDQLMRWKKIIYEFAAKGPRDPDDQIESCMEALLEKDPDLQAFHMMDSAEQARERILMGNSIQGFLGYLRESS